MHENPPYHPLNVIFFPSGFKLRGRLQYTNPVIGPRPKTPCPNLALCSVILNSTYGFCFLAGMRYRIAFLFQNGDHVSLESCVSFRNLTSIFLPIRFSGDDFKSRFCHLWMVRQFVSEHFYTPEKPPSRISGSIVIFCAKSSVYVMRRENNLMMIIVCCIIH